MAVLTRAKIVAFLSGVTFLVACHSNPMVRKTNAEGLSTVFGQKLVAHEWCGQTQLDEDNHYVTDHFTFLPDGTVQDTSMQLQKESASVPLATSKGTWSVENDQLFMTHGSETLESSLSTTVRASDGVKCLTLAASATTATLCPCAN